LFILGWLAVTVVVFDYPIASTFTPEKVTRRMMLRRQHFDWVDVRQITRTRPNFIRVDRNAEHGGLAVLKGRRQYLLVDRSESGGEFDVLADVLERSGEEIGVDQLLRPGDKLPPTWLYRRKRWRPDSADGR